MAKKITDSQLIGELGETAARKRFLSMGFQFDLRSRLEAGIDGIAEIMIEGEPTARMIAVQVKSTRSGSYASETDHGFTYLLTRRDLDYWRTSTSGFQHSCEGKLTSASEGSVSVQLHQPNTVRRCELRDLSV